MSVIVLRGENRVNGSFGVEVRFACECGFWWKIEAWTVPPTRERPHGIRYTMTLHNRLNRRVFGYDNAHAVKPRKNKRFSGKRYDYDHLHRTVIDQGTPYEFQDIYTLLQDFFAGIDATIVAIEGKSHESKNRYYV